MKLPNILTLSISHIATLAAGFALGIYMLPILIAPPAPTESEVQASSQKASYSAEFVKDLKGSDRLHWGEGKVSVGSDFISFEGELSPGPDYKLYLSPKFVETEAEFQSIKSSMVRIGDIKTFDNFIVEVKPNTNIEAYTTVVVWCETFGEFITAGKYK